MSRFRFSAVALLLIPVFSFAGEKAPEKVVDLANDELVALASSAEIVQAVKAQNAEKKSLDKIKELDEKWKKTAGIDDFMKSLMESDCGKVLRGIQKEKKYIDEIFVMDNQGANVAMSDKTSDYWQGDEAKFIESYKGGKGAIHISEVEFDDSVQAYLVQVSIPVKDGDKVIGAVTFGINVDSLE